MCRWVIRSASSAGRARESFSDHNLSELDIAVEVRRLKVNSLEEVASLSVAWDDECASRVALARQAKFARDLRQQLGQRILLNKSRNLQIIRRRLFKQINLIDHKAA